MPSTRGQSSSHNNHLNALLDKHELLGRRIEKEQKYPSMREDVLRRLKAEKLRLRDEIEQERHQA